VARKRLINVRKQERPYERRYRDAVNEIGGMMRKCEHKIEKGWPDNYAAPNFWMEFKWIEFFSDRSISFWRHFDEQQKVMLRDLSLRGCNCYVVVFWDMGLKYGKRVQTIEYLAARQHDRFDHSLILPFADPIEEIRSHVAVHWRVERTGPKTTLVKTAETKTKLDRSAHPLIRGAT
jgi:hypothetical protein